MHTLFLHITKGGTGKSLSTYQLAWVMGELFEKRVLIVDLDPQANISFLLGVNGNDVIKSGGFTIAHCLSKDLNIDRKRKNIRECIYETNIPNVHLAVGSTAMLQAEVNIVSDFNRHLILDNALKDVEDDYDYVFIDTHSKHDQMFFNALAATDLLIPTLQANFQNLQKFIDTMEALEEYKENGIYADIGGAILTTFEPNTYQGKECLEYLKDKNYEIWGVVKKQVAVVDSPMNNLPIYKYAPSNQGSWAYIRIAHNILNYFEEDKEIPLDKKYRRKKMI